MRIRDMPRTKRHVLTYGLGVAGSPLTPSWVLRADGVPAAVDLYLGNSTGPLYYANGATLSDSTSLISVSRASNGYAQNADGTLTLFGNNVPRIGVGTGLLIEEARTNIALQSQAFDNAAWTKLGTSTTVTPNNVVAPDGTSTADSVLETDTVSSGLRTAASITVTTATTYSYSVYIKRSNVQWIRLYAADTGGLVNGVRGWFDVQNGAVGTLGTSGAGWTAVSSRIDAVANGFYRLTITFTTSGTSLTLQLNSAIADNSGTRVTNGAYAVWQVDNQLGSFQTSPIPTTTTSVARAADNIIAANTLNTTLLGSPGAFVAYVSGVPNTSVLRRIINYNTGLYFAGFLNGVTNQSQISDGVNAATATFTGSALSLTGTAASWGASTSASIVTNGGTVNTNASASRTAATGTIQIGDRGGTFDRSLNTYIRRLAAYGFQPTSGAIQSNSVPQ